MICTFLVRHRDFSGLGSLLLAYPKLSVKDFGLAFLCEITDLRLCTEYE